MDKKKLQLSEIKVKSLVTLVDQQEQKTAKGGYYKNAASASISIHIPDNPSWTEYKTRVAVNNDVTLLGVGNTGGNQIS